MEKKGKKGGNKGTSSEPPQQSVPTGDGQKTVGSGNSANRQQQQQPQRQSLQQQRQNTQSKGSINIRETEKQEGAWSGKREPKQHQRQGFQQQQSFQQQQQAGYHKYQGAPDKSEQQQGQKQVGGDRSRGGSWGGQPQGRAQQRRSDKSRATLQGGAQPEKYSQTLRGEGVGGRPGPQQTSTWSGQQQGQTQGGGQLEKQGRAQRGEGDGGCPGSQHSSTWRDQKQGQAHGSKKRIAPQQGGVQPEQPCQTQRSEGDRGLTGPQQSGAWSNQQQGQIQQIGGRSKIGQQGPVQQTTGDRGHGDSKQIEVRTSQQHRQVFQAASVAGRGGPQETREQSFRGAPQRQLQQEPDPPFQGVSCAGIQRGTLGSRSIVETNYFTMDLSKMPDIAFHYDVTITPDRPKKFMRTVFDQCQRQYFSKVAMAFDGSKSCYIVQRLENAVYNFKIEVADGGTRMKEFNIQIKETDAPVVELKSLKSYHKDRIFDKPMRALQALEVVLSYTYHELGLRVGRSFYRKPENMYDLKDGYEMYTGIYQAAILGEEPLLNVDISHKSFPKAQSVIDYLYEIGVQNLNSLIVRPFLQKVIYYLKGITVLYTPPECFAAAEKRYKVSGVGDSANNTYFKNEDGKQISVSSYYNMRGYKLNYPHLNCLEIRSGTRNISLPMELCTILDYQSLMRKDTQVSQIIRHSATSTMVRKEKIMNLLHAFQTNENCITQHFGIGLGCNFIKVQMRLLSSPQLQYLGGLVTPRTGAWQIGNGCQFLDTSKPPGGHKWAIIYADKSRIHNVVDNFKDSVYKIAQRLNVNLSDKCEIASFQNIDMTLQKLGQAQYALVFVILPQFGTTYSNVKQTAELKYGVLTQCIKEQTVVRSLRDLSVCNNLLLKVNAKLNGTNHKVAEDRDGEIRQLMMPLKNVMFLGADVTHPSPDQRNIPSVVGVAASHDANGACYNMQYRLQKPKLEDIEDMESITTHHLQVYKSYQKCYPDYIIYYRDGVSDGQFPIIRNRELRGIRSACKKLQCNAKLTCLVVVKRHHTRFFPLKISTKDKFNNVEPGTVVDQRIVHPNEVQFFLVSHQAIQGTAKPSRYNVIEDDAKFNVDLLQKLSYNLCHLFPRCNRAVSYPAPAYLAHLVAFRGRVYLEGVQRFGNLKAEYEKRMVQNNFMQRNPMYFV